MLVFFITDNLGPLSERGYEHFLNLVIIVDLTLDANQNMLNVLI